jgi:hypothetical protein
MLDHGFHTMAIDIQPLRGWEKVHSKTPFYIHQLDVHGFHTMAINIQPLRGWVKGTLQKHQFLFTN